MAATVLVKFQGDLGELEAAISKLDQSTDQLSESAAAAGKKVSEEYRKVASSAKAAFASSEVDSAIKAQAANVDKLSENLELLYKEELRLLKLNKEATAEFRNNQAAIAATRKEFDGLRKGVSDVNKELPKTAKEISELEDELKKLALEGKQGTQQFKDTAKAIGEYKAAITTADRAVDLYAKSTDAATGRLGELEDKLYDLALAGQTNTQEFKDTIAEVTKLKRAVFEVDQQVDSYVERSRGLTAVVQNVELVGNAFQIVEGATAAFGVESEDLQETLVRLNAIIAVTNGLEQVRTILLEQSAKKTGIVAAAQRIYASAVNQTTGALNRFKVALIASGTGAILAAVALIAAYWDDIKESIGGASAESNKLLKTQEKSTKEAQTQLELLESQDNQLKLQGLSEQDILNKKIAQTDEIINQLKLQKQAAKEVADEQIKNTSKVAAVLRGANLGFLSDLFGIGDVAQVAAAGNEVQDELDKQLNEILEKRAGYLLALNKTDSNNIVDNTKEQTDALKEQAKAYEQLAIVASDVTKQLLESDKNIREATTNALVASREAELSRLRVLFEQGLATRQQVAEAETKIVLANQRAQIEGIEQSLKDSLNGVKEGTLEEQTLRNAAKQEILKVEAQSAEQIFNINKQLNQNIEESEKKAQEERKQRNEELIKEVTQYVGAVQSVFSSIVDLQNELTERRIEQINRLRDVELEAIEVSSKSEAQKQREREALEVRTNRKIIEEKRKVARLNKAQGIFDAVVNTAVAVTNALKQDPPLSFILAAAAGVTGGIQVAKISSEPLPSFGRGGWIDGEPHTRGGVDINAEGGEFVTRKSQAGTFRRELEAMNTSRASFLKLIENNYVKPRLMAATLERDRNGVSVNVNARLNSGVMETELRGLRQETRKTGKIMQKLVASSNSSRYNW
jgi:hypothetical protein